jgi:hypothetical protein
MEELATEKMTDSSKEIRNRLKEPVLSRLPYKEMDINHVVYVIHNNRAMRIITMHSTCKLHFDY